MDTQEKVKCIACGEEFDSDREGTWVNDGPICQGCLEGDEEHASTLINFSQNGKQVFKFGDYFCWGGDYDDADLSRILGPRKYVSTGGWRGYYDTPLAQGYVKLTDGWSTGFPDSTTQRKKTIFDLSEWLERSGKSAPGEGLYVLIEPTSNIFSQAMTIFCAENDIEDIKAWLDESGFGVEVLEYALG